MGSWIRAALVGAAISSALTCATAGAAGPQTVAPPRPAVRIAALPKACRVSWVPDLRGSVAGVALDPGETVSVRTMRLKQGAWVVSSEATLPLGFSDGGARFRERLPLGRGYWRIVVTLPARAGAHGPVTSEVRVRVVRKRLVALTFDGGPWPTYTDQVRRILRRNDVPATFFVIGSHLVKYPAPEKRVVAEPVGHQIGNHSMSHPNMARISASRVRSEVSACQRVCKRELGVRPTRFRPPYGATSAALQRTVASTGLGWTMWSADSIDWDSRTSAEVYGRTMRRVRPGAVVLLHDGGGDRRVTVAALPRIIAELKRRGYDFVTVDELAAIRAAEKAARLQAR